MIDKSLLTTMVINLPMYLFVSSFFLFFNNFFCFLVLDASDFSFSLFFFFCAQSRRSNVLVHFILVVFSLVSASILPDKIFVS